MLTIHYHNGETEDVPVRVFSLAAILGVAYLHAEHTGKSISGFFFEAKL